MMGMGEPLANFDNVVPRAALSCSTTTPTACRAAASRCRRPASCRAIDRLRDECPVALAVSLHAPNDALRDRLVPINRKYPLAELLAACVRYLERAPRDFVTFEYVMLDGVNDSAEHARELVALVRDVPCKFNLIPFNPFPGTEFRTSPRARIRRVPEDAAATPASSRRSARRAATTSTPPAASSPARCRTGRKRRARDAHRAAPAAH